MKTKHVVVLQYDAEWKEQFEKIKCELSDALAGLYIAIEHIGSTAVEGLAAKPIIDIDVVIDNNEIFEIVKEKLAEIGYAHEGNLGIDGREAFAYTGKEHLQKHHLYVCAADSCELNRHIRFRDFLRSNPEAVAKYSEVKKTAADLFPEDIEKYIQYKSGCIKEFYKQCGLE